MVNLTECARDKLDGVPASIVAMPGMCRLCGFFLHISHEDEKPANIANYRNPTLEKCQVVHNHTYKAYLAVSTILILDCSIYGKLIKDLYNSHSMGIDHYPRKHSKTQDIIFHWPNHAARYGLRLPPGAIVFTQDNDDGPTGDKMNANNFQRKPRYLNKFKYFK